MVGLAKARPKIKQSSTLIEQSDTTTGHLNTLLLDECMALWGELVSQ